MDPNTNPDGNMGPSLRPPIFCPSCGSAHQFNHSFGERDFILARLRDLQSGHRCPTEDVPVIHTNNPNCVVQPHQGTQTQQHRTPDISLSESHIEVLNHVAQLPNDYTRQGNQDAILAGAGRPHSHYDAHPNEEHPIEALTYPHNSPTLSEDSTVRLDGHKSISTPPKHSRRGLSDASMEHIDEFSILPIPPENSPGLSAASMEPLDHFSTLPIPEGDPNQDHLRMQNGSGSCSGPNPSTVHARNLAATKAGLHLLAEFYIFPRPERYYRSSSMPAEGKVRQYQHIANGIVPPPMPHRPESLPGSNSDWASYQVWEEFPPPGSQRNGLAADIIMIDDDDDDDNDNDNDSVDSDRTVTMSMVSNRENSATVMPRAEDIPIPSVEGVEDVAMLNVEDIPIPSVEDTPMPSMDDLLRAPPPLTIMRPEPATRETRL